MTSYVFLMVLFSAFCHATWNFVARKAAGNLVAVWLGLWLGCTIIFPGVVGVAVSQGLHELARAPALICIIATGLIHGVYFRLLALGYEHGEISLVYPIARGSGIALTAILASLLLNEEFTRTGWIGIGLISLGILSLSADARGKAGGAKAVALALCMGSSTVAYSLVDKVGVGYAHPVLYIWLMFLIAAAVLTPSVMRRHRGSLRREARQYFGHAVVIGGGSIGTYLIILYAFTMAPVGYVVAVRESAVVLGSLAGIIFLKERFTMMKIGAICLIVIGVVGIRLS